MPFVRGESRLSEQLAIVNMTQAELARRTGYSPQMISKFALGHKKMSADALYTISVVIGCPMESLCYWVEKRQ
ncbi:helix-turn-helix transcriptional regulator [Paenibacillus glucanolyticus]|uniref:helix-turn-helix domain-containing protein n=1 Tax=Paenibacillus glucanolyticus TaxID=59843 RepID=UPI0030CA5EE5